MQAVRAELAETIRKLDCVEQAFNDYVEMATDLINSTCIPKALHSTEDYCCLSGGEGSDPLLLELKAVLALKHSV